MKKFENYEGFTVCHHLVPDIVALDVFKRVADWLSSGGSVDDDYVKNQICYANKHIEIAKA